MSFNSIVREFYDTIKERLPGPVSNPMSCTTYNSSTPLQLHLPATALAPPYSSRTPLWLHQHLISPCWEWNFFSTLWKQTVHLFSVHPISYCCNRSLKETQTESGFWKSFGMSAILLSPCRERELGFWVFAKLLRITQLQCSSDTGPQNVIIQETVKMLVMV